MVSAEFISTSWAETGIAAANRTTVAARTTTIFLIIKHLFHPSDIV